MRRTLLAVAIVLTASLALAACASSTPTASAQKDACFGTMALVQAEMDLFHADAGLYPPLADVQAKTGWKCPSGGKYSFDETAGVLSCSIHGAYKKP